MPIMTTVRRGAEKSENFCVMDESGRSCTNVIEVESRVRALRIPARCFERYENPNSFRAPITSLVDVIKGRLQRHVRDSQRRYSVILTLSKQKIQYNQDLQRPLLGRGIPS